MDESEAVEQEQNGAAATPIFSVYRRGYDPEQVDRYVADQQRRMDEALHRASESERKLAAAVGQLRELHRRVAVYESEARSAQPPQLDSLGERVQRILQEAWEGAYNLRQEAEREVTDLRDVTQRELSAQREQAERDIDELRQVASREAAELVDEATRRALALRDEMERRRQAYLERVERDRQRAVSQITYLYDQRQLAISELARLQATVQATIEEMVRSPLGKPTAAILESAPLREEEDDLVSEDVEANADDPDEEENELLEVEGEVADSLPGRHARSITLFEEIIQDEEDSIEEETPPQAEISGWQRESVEAETSAEAAEAYEVPTGPMETVGYGYSNGSTAAASEGQDEPRSERPRNYGGVYDAEADGWG